MTLPLYVHIPFCRSKCGYCDFFSVPCHAVPDAYLDALCNELHQARRDLGVDSWQSVYVGGGTPSMLSAGQMARLLACIGAQSVAPGAEVTVELNPEGVTPDMLNALADGGVTRLSLGIQSMGDAALAAVGRHGTRRSNCDALELLGSRWRGQVSLDLMAGLPSDSAESFAESVRDVLGYAPGHLSLYTLTVEEGTPLCATIDGGLDWDPDQADDLWLMGRDMLVAAGYRQYEVSNFALPGCECQHNAAYWSQQSYVGCGAGATGSVYCFGGDAPSVRWTDCRDISAWTAFWLDPARHRGGVPQAVRQTERLSLATLEFEFLMLGLRTLRGVSEADYRGRYASLAPCHGDLALRLGSSTVWRGLLQEGSATVSGTPGTRRFALTPAGLLRLNLLLRDLV